MWLLKVFPGLPPEILLRIAELEYHGIVIEGFGSGNLPTQENALIDAIQRVVKKGCSVVISSQCAFGQADLSIYEVSRAAADVGAISASDMTSEAALVKLAWVLGHTSDADEVEEMMAKEYVGEVSHSGAVGFGGT